MSQNFENFTVRTEQSSEEQGQYSINSPYVISMQDCTLNGSFTNIIKQLQKKQIRKYTLSKSQKYCLEKQMVNITKQKSKSARLYSQDTIVILPSSIKKMLAYRRNIPNLSKSQLTDKCYGAMFGFIIGDIVGAYLVSQKVPEEKDIFQALMMNGGGTFNLKAAQGTDQTGICLSAAAGLASCHSHYNPQCMASSYYSWFKSKPFDYPALIAIAFRSIRENIREKAHLIIKASSKNIQQESNIGLMRVIPLVIWSINNSEAEFFTLLKKQLQMFTPNQLVFEVCFVYGKILRDIIINGNHQSALHKASIWVHAYGSQKLVEYWQLSQSNYSLICTSRSLNDLKYPFVYSMSQLSHKEIDFLQPLLRTLKRGYSTDSNCAIVMGLIGSVVGYKKIPNYFIHKIINQKSNSAGLPWETYRMIESVAQIMSDQIRQIQ